MEKPESKSRQKRKGTQLNGNIEPANVSAYQSRAVEARRGLHEFASDILNLVTECMDATGLHWDDWKRQLPGYDAAMKARRLRAAGDHWDASGELDAAVKAVQQLPADKVKEAARLLEQLAAKEKTKAKPKAS